MKILQDATMRASCYAPLLKKDKRGNILQLWELWHRRASIFWNGVLRCQSMACLENWAPFCKSRPAGRLNRKQIWPLKGKISSSLQTGSVSLAFSQQKTQGGYFCFSFFALAASVPELSAKCKAWFPLLRFECGTNYKQYCLSKSPALASGRLCQGTLGSAFHFAS